VRVRGIVVGSAGCFVFVVSVVCIIDVGVRACRFLSCRVLGSLVCRGGVTACHRGAVKRGRRRPGRLRDAGPAGQGGGRAGGGRVDYQVIVFTNISNVTCTLYGYPGVSLAAGTPVTQVGQAASRSPVAGPSVVTLTPGQAANALLRITQAVNYPSGTCSPAKTTYLQIYPPNQTTPIYLAYSSTGCSSNSVNLLTIGVVQAGAGSSGQ